MKAGCYGVHDSATMMHANQWLLTRSPSAVLLFVLLLQSERVCVKTPWHMQIASWWDYGYQTTAMANRTVIVDNNTWNNTHIATVGRAMASPEHLAWQIYRDLDVKYVLVVFGGFVG